MKKFSFLAGFAALLCLVIFPGCHSKQDWASIFTKKGDQYSAREKYDLALDEYVKAIQIDSKYRQAYWGAALVYHKLGKLRYALEMLNTIVTDLEVDNLGIYEELRGDILSELEEFEEAQQVYKNALVWMPDCESCKNKLNSLKNLSAISEVA